MNKAAIVGEISQLFDKVEQSGYERGLREAMSYLDMIACVVPERTTKRQLIEQAQKANEILTANYIQRGKKWTKTVIHKIMR